jgi:MGT family glycosyltransferase
LVGSVAGLRGLYPRLYRAAIEPLAGVGARVVVTVGDDADPDELGPLPPNVHVVRWAPQDRVIPHAAAVVCHGGYGSVLGALAHGVPLVTVPLFADDQWRNARRVAEVGAGIAVASDGGRERRMLDGPAPEVFARLPDAVEQVLGDAAYRRAARAIAREIEALPPVDAAVGVLARLPDQAGAATA